jgi:hypothetical protein
MVAEAPNKKSKRLHQGLEAIQNLRRILLGLSQHHLYYSADVEAQIVEVLALWHTSRGSAPRF